MTQTTLNTGLTKDNNHLKLIAAWDEVELTTGLNYTSGMFIVCEIALGGDYGKAGALKVNVTKELKQYHQYDTKVKAQRKFDRLNVLSN